ncbi:hypothetical protein [Microbacterium aurum]
MKVTCSEVDCLDPQLTDLLPAALAGFPIEDVVFTPQTTPIVVTWSSTGDDTPPATVGTNTADWPDVTGADAAASAPVTAWAAPVPISIGWGVPASAV